MVIAGYTAGATDLIKGDGNRTATEAVESRPPRPDLASAIKAIRETDCGAWLKDCSSPMGITCDDGRAKRMELMHAINDLYRAAGI